MKEDPLCAESTEGNSFGDVLDVEEDTPSHFLELLSNLRMGKDLGVKKYDKDLKLAKAATSGMAAAMAQMLVKGYETKSLAATLTKTLGATLGASLSHLVPMEIIRTISGPLVSDVSGKTSDQIAKLAVPKIVKQVKTFIEGKIVKKSGVPEALSMRLNTTIPQALSRYVADSLSSRVASPVVHITGHLLSLSLAQTLTPALIATLAESPLNDYYCFYCSKDKVYCEYCKRSARQVYWGQYYAGYYSMYYADYYSSYYANDLLERTRWSRSRNLQQIFGRAAFETPFAGYGYGPSTGAYEEGKGGVKYPGVKPA